MTQKFNCCNVTGHNDHCYVFRKKGEACKLENTIPNVKHVVGCFAAGETGALYKIDGIMGKSNDVDILTQHLKTSARHLKLGEKWVFQMDNDSKHFSKVMTKWLKDNKVNVLLWPHKALT